MRFGRSSPERSLRDSEGMVRSSLSAFIMSVLREAGADRRWITDGSLRNRCGYPRREQSAKICKAKRRDPNCSDHNQNPVLQIPRAEKKPRLRSRCLTRLTNLNFVSCTHNRQAFRRATSKIVVNSAALKTSLSAPRRCYLSVVFNDAGRLARVRGQGMRTRPSELISARNKLHPAPLHRHR